MISAIIISTVLYMFLIGIFIIGFGRLKTAILDEQEPASEFSILIPFRNEENNLEPLLKSLLSLDYPKNDFEVVLINDSSTDGYEKVLESFNKTYPELKFKLLHSNSKSRAPKKEALIKGIEASRFDWIVTTDADCQLPKKWLSYIDKLIQSKKAAMIAGPVAYQTGTGFLHEFQNVHFSGLIGSGMGGFGIGLPFLCNGANLCFNKAIFYEVSGYSLNLNVTGGDDMFLMERFLNSNHVVTFTKSAAAVVRTKPQATWAAFFQQQLRWAAKTKHFSRPLPKAIGLLVFLQNALLICLLFLTAFNGFYLPYLMACFLGKTSVDLMLVNKTMRVLQLQSIGIKTLLISIIHPLFIVLTALFSQFMKFRWKKRKFDT